MQILTRPSAYFYFAMLPICAFFALVAMGVYLVIDGSYDAFATPPFFVVSGIIAAVPAGTCIWLLARRCEWTVDYSGVTSTVLGRIEFSEVVALYASYPQAMSATAAVTRSLIDHWTGGASVDDVRILRLADGRLLPIVVCSPAIAHHEEFVAKLTELLVGKLRPISDLSPADVAALLARKANRFIKP